MPAETSGHKEAPKSRGERHQDKGKLQVREARIARRQTLREEDLTQLKLR